MADSAPKDLASWTAFLTSQDVPVLKRTVRGLAEMRERIDEVNGREVARLVLDDPLMTLRVLVYMQQAHKTGRLRSDITTIEHAVMMMGIHPFFNHFNELPAADDLLKSSPQALLGLLAVVRRSQRAARFAREWAFHRHDLEIEEVEVSALLHSIAEIMVWIHSPGQAMEIGRMLKESAGMRSVQAQQQVLGFAGRELQAALVRAWGLPSLLTRLMDEDDAANPRVLNVLLAHNLARHLANGWDDPALPDDYNEIIRLLHIGYPWLLSRIGHPEPDEENLRLQAIERARLQETVADEPPPPPPSENEAT